MSIQEDTIVCYTCIHNTIKGEDEVCPNCSPDGGTTFNLYERQPEIVK